MARLMPTIQLVFVPLAHVGTTVKDGMQLLTFMGRIDESSILLEAALLLILAPFILALGH